MRYCFVVVLLTFSGLVSAEDAVFRTYQLAEHGEFRLKVPASWKDSVSQRVRGAPPTITFRAQNGSPSFQVIVTPVWPMRPDIKAPTMEELRRNVQEASDEAISQAVEATLVVKELKGVSNGYYFTATDRAPKPGEYKLMNQGMVGAQDLRVAFTILTNDGEDAIVKAALAMMTTAEHH